MNDTAPTPPDMSKEQAAELKQLCKNLAKVESDINQEEAGLRREINKLDAMMKRENARIYRSARKELKSIAAALQAEQRPLRTRLVRLREGRHPAFKARAAIAKRIAILEGRLGS